MKVLKFVLPALVVSATAVSAQTPPAKTAAKPAATRQSAAAKKDLVEFEMMTWPEVKAAMAAGKTTALFYTGGTEQRGPQNVNGGHTLMGREIVRTIAQRLGNAIAMPVLPYTPNNASADLPGTIGLTPELLGAILERVTEQAMTTGFKNVVLMGDHGGGQPADLRRRREEDGRQICARGQSRLLLRRGLRQGAGRLRQVARRSTAIRAARTPAFPTRRRCCISAATRAGSARI